MGQYGQASAPAAKRYVGQKIMKCTKIEFVAALLAALIIQFITIVPNPMNAVAFALLALLTIRPLLTMNKYYKVVSGLLLVYFLAIAAQSYIEGKRHQEYMATDPIKRTIEETKREIERRKQQERLPNQAL